MKPETVYLVAGAKPWSRRAYEEMLTPYPGKWEYVEMPDQLAAEHIVQINPRYIFFLHWSWKVPQKIIENYECVCFHMTDVPYGRGGSPLQNLILRGHRSTKLSALRMTAEFDAGPVYMKKDLSLEGGAEEIYLRASYLSAEMIIELIEKTPVPVSQQGKITLFERRKMKESSINGGRSLGELYDFIRMLDAEGYPKAFIERQGFRYEFSRAGIYDGCIKADVTITMAERSDR